MTTKQRLLCVALIAVTACGGTAAATQNEPAPSTTAAPLTTTTTIPPTTTTTEATTTTVDEIAAAGAHYLEIVAPSNCLIEQITAIEDSVVAEDGYIYDDKWDEMVVAGLLPLYAQLSESDIAFLEALAAYEWPATVEGDIDALTEELSASASWALAVSESQSFDDWLGVWGNPPESSAPAVVRAKLGLESNIGSEVVDCPAA